MHGIFTGSSPTLGVLTMKVKAKGLRIRKHDWRDAQEGVGVAKLKCMRRKGGNFFPRL
jgi:hypothetical protein